MERVKVKIFRYDPSEDKSPRYETYEVPHEKDMRILDVLMFVQENLANSLAFRYSCRRRRCGTCSVMVNGRPVLACMEGVEPEMTIEPLPNLPIIRDLVVDTKPYEEGIRDIRPFLERRQLPQEEPERLDPQGFLPLRPLQTCIECYLCMSACPVIDLKWQGFSGPATLVQLARRALDPRDDLDRPSLALGGGLVHCVSCYSCTNVCPVEINVLEEGIERLRDQCITNKTETWARFNKTFMDLVRDGGTINPFTLIRKTSTVRDLLSSFFVGLRFFLKGKISLRQKKVSNVEEIRKIYDATGETQ